MPKMNTAVRLAAATAALAAGSSAGVASAAEHAHTTKHHGDSHHVEKAHHRRHVKDQKTTHHRAAEHKKADHKKPAHRTAAEHTAAEHKKADHKKADHKKADHKKAHHKKADHKKAHHKKADHKRKHKPTSTSTSATAAAPAAPATATATASPTAPTTSSPSSSVQPVGMSGSWNLSFDDEFNGTSLNTSVWNDHNGWANQNGVTDEAANVTESGGEVVLSLPSTSSGATIGTNEDVLAVGDYAEARVEFAGNGTDIYDWPAWWASGPNWPAAGENDIAEGLGTLTVNYHSPSGTHNEGTVAGDWANQFNTYGIYRGSNYCDVYWNGQLVKRYSTDDNGQPQSLLFTIGYGGSNFTPAQLKVDYVRVWSPAS